MQHIAALVFAAVAPCLFDAPRDIDVSVTIVAAADFDRDGRLDLVAHDALYLGLTTKAALPLAAGEDALRVDDVNGDGRPDILAASGTSLITLVNDGGGTFTRHVVAHESSPAIPSQRVWGDFDGDARLDVLVTGVGVFLGNGDGTFHAADTFRVQRQWVAADLDGDGRDDLVAASQPGTAAQTIFYLREPGGAAFQPAQTGGVVPTLEMLAVDFDRDGRDELLVSDGFSNSSLVFNLASASPRQDLRLTPGFYTAADLDGDGAPDLISMSESVLTVFLNDGHGAIRVVETLPVFPRPLAVPPLPVDADGDGLTDLVVRNDAGLFVLHGNGDGTFRVPRTALAPAAVDSGASGDFDGDGDDDLVTTAYVAWNDGTGTFRIAPVSDARLVNGTILRAADADGDGALEVLVAHSGFVRVLELKPDGAIVDRFSLSASATDAAIGDFAGNGHRELAVIIPGNLQAGPRMEVYAIGSTAPRFVGTLPNDGTSILAADVNGDGRDDVIVATGKLIENCCHGFAPSGTAGILTVFRSLETSFVAEPGTVEPSAAFTNLTAGDFDGDGRTDLAYSTLFSSPPRVLVDYGNGTRQSVDAGAAYRAHVLRAADFDGDGRTDLAVDGAWRVFYGAPGGIVERARYLSPLPGANLPFVARRARGAPPSLLVLPASSAKAFVYDTVCPRSRAVRRSR